MSFGISGGEVEGLMKELAETKDKGEFIGVLSKFNENFVSRYKEKSHCSIGNLPYEGVWGQQGMNIFNRMPPPAEQNSVQRPSFITNSHDFPSYVDPYFAQAQNSYARQPNIDPYIRQPLNSPLNCISSNTYTTQIQNFSQSQPSVYDYGYQVNSNDRNPSIYYQENLSNSWFYDSITIQKDPCTINQQTPQKNSIYYSKNSAKELHPKAFIRNYKPYQSDTKDHQTEFENWIHIRKQKEAELIGFYKN